MTRLRDLVARHPGIASVLMIGVGVWLVAVAYAFTSGAVAGLLRQLG